MRTLFAASVVLLLVCFVVSISVLSKGLQYTEENIEFAIHPSAALALEYGERHFDAQNPSEYNIDRAEYFFQQAATIDPTTPYLFHELARIAFLRGEFNTALSDIDIEIAFHGSTEPNTYYVRGLIEGYMGDYADAIVDYQHFLAADPRNWAGINDYAWVLLKGDRPQDAVVATAYGLKYFPDNPWLLNSNAIALYEVGLLGPALDQESAALTASEKMTEQDWLQAYPGNDPAIATQGISSFRSAATQNMHTIELAQASSTLQLQILHD